MKKVKTISFSQIIAASADKIWNVLWDDETYPQWTAAFAAGSHALSDWKEGSEIQFLDGNNNGMYSKIEKSESGKFMKFIHLGTIKGGKKEKETDTNGGWKEMEEAYILTEDNGKTKLEVSMDIPEKYADELATMFPSALDVIKELSESPVSITVRSHVHAPIKEVWNFWTRPEHITQWNNASPDWHTPRAENDLKEGGRFSSRMEAKDGSMGFDFEGKYTKVEENATLNYTMDDNRKVEIRFEASEDGVIITQTFEAEDENSYSMQKQGWNNILQNFKKYAESV